MPWTDLQVELASARRARLQWRARARSGGRPTSRCSNAHSQDQCDPVKDQAPIVVPITSLRRGVDRWERGWAVPSSPRRCLVVQMLTAAWTYSAPQSPWRHSRRGLVLMGCAARPASGCGAPALLKSPTWSGWDSWWNATVGSRCSGERRRGRGHLERAFERGRRREHDQNGSGCIRFDVSKWSEQISDDDLWTRLRGGVPWDKK